MSKCLAIIDVQNDFVDGSLGTSKAQAMLPSLVEYASAFEGRIVFTKDTHFSNYLETPEGKALPVKHCIKGTHGWELASALSDLALKRHCRIYEKKVFGSVKLARDLKSLYEHGKIDEVELCGLCTDICVIANAVLIHTLCPKLPLLVNSKCCAGVTPQKHQSALDVMASLQIKVI